MQRHQETRSFQEEDDDMNVDPIPTRNVTLPKLAKGINQLHVCFEEQKKQTAILVSMAEGAQKDINNIKAVPRRILYFLVGTAISAWVGLFVQNYFFHRAAQHSNDQAVATAAVAAHAAQETDRKTTAIAKAVGAEP